MVLRKQQVHNTPSAALIQVGIDCGQIGDSTAISVAEWESRSDGQHFAIRRLERLALGSSYPAQAGRIAELLRNLRRLGKQRELRGESGFVITTALDVTGIGRGLYDLLTERGEKVVPVTITGTDRLTRRDDGECSCGKSVLVSSLLVAIQSGRLHLPEVAEAEVLLEELGSFRLETTASGHVTFNAASGSHDDLLTALGLSTLPGLRKSNRGPIPAVGKTRRRVW